MIEPLLLSTTRLSTYVGGQLLTAATAFFFEREERLYLVTSRHVLHDAPTGHLPDRVELVVHTDAQNLTRQAVLSLLLYRNGKANWHQGTDSRGPVDVAVMELDRAVLPVGTVLHAFGPEHLVPASEPGIEVGQPLLMVGFPLGFYDTLHHLPVARHAVIASAYGVRFQGEGYFLTDGRMHRGASGAPVVMRRPSPSADALPWRLLGVHSARMDMNSRDQLQDDSLGLNSAWYADMLLTLTAQPAAARATSVTP